MGRSRRLLMYPVVTVTPDEATASGDEATASGDEATASGDEATASGDKAKDASTEKTSASADESKLLKKFYFNRSTDAGAAVELENQLRAEKVEYTYLEPRQHPTDHLLHCLDWSSLGHSVFPVHDVAANEKRHHGWRLFVGFQQEPCEEV